MKPLGHINKDDQRNGIVPAEHYDAAYREIVIRHGTKLDLDQVLETLIDIGWTPPKVNSISPKDGL